MINWKKKKGKKRIRDREEVKKKNFYLR